MSVSVRVEASLTVEGAPVLIAEGLNNNSGTEKRSVPISTVFPSGNS